MKEAELAGALDRARLEGREIERLTLAHADLSLEQAYLIQEEGLRLRLARGGKIVGHKMGLTSKAKMKQMGVEFPIRGILTSDMRVVSGGMLNLKGLIHPRVEPEIAFLVARELRGPVSPEEALRSCSGVCAALEIIDSRYKDFNFTLPDVIADNCSCCAFVLGEMADPAQVDLADMKISLEINGKMVQEGSSSAICGHPANSLAELCAMLAQSGKSLEAGSVVLAGAATQAVSLAPGANARAVVERLGEASLRTV